MSHSPTIPVESVDPAALSVLVIEDEPMLRSTLQEFLEFVGFERLFLAGDGHEALAVLRREPVDCVLSDIRMPAMGLDELLPTLRQEYPELIVIACSGNPDFETAATIFRLGAHDFLAKPLDLVALESALRWVVERRIVLRAARGWFGPQAASDESDDERLDRLDALLGRAVAQFRPLIAHARRLGRLARRLQTGMDERATADLALAAYLHECGASRQMVTLCGQPRRLDPEELHLVQAHCDIAGDLVARALDRPDLGVVIRRQNQWDQADGAWWRQADRPDRLACWLGLLNTADALLQDRPDRPALTLEQLRAWMIRRREPLRAALIDCLLEQWPAVERFYRDAASDGYCETSDVPDTSPTS